MSFFSRKNGSKGKGVETPAYDPYGRYKNTGEGVFGFRKDKNVIIPGVTSYEQKQLVRVQEYVAKETGKECTLSQDLINDVYSIYVNGDVKRRPSNDDNEIRHKVLDKVYDSLTKVVTVDSPLFTQVLTRELALVLQKVDDDVKQEQENQKDNGEGGGEGEGEGLESSMGEGDSGDDKEDDDKSKDQSENNGSKGATKDSGSSNRQNLESIVDNALNNATDAIEKAKETADEKIKDLENQIGKEAIKDLMGNDPEFLEKIDELKYQLEAVTINKDSIRKVMEKILNESMNYFSSKFKRVEESLFDCEDCEDLFGLEFLNPVFRNAELMSIGNESRIYKGKMDLFIDCSGSMSSNAQFEGNNLRMIDLAKGIAMVLFRMGMIENLYFFDGRLHQINNVNELTILSFSKSGGTNFENVIAKIKENGNNSVIITDGYDQCESYTKKAFWIGIGGTTFSNNDGAFPTYKATKQCVAYNPHSSRFDYCN